MPLPVAEVLLPPDQSSSGTNSGCSLFKPSLQPAIPAPPALRDALQQWLSFGAQQGDFDGCTLFADTNSSEQLGGWTSFGTSSGVIDFTMFNAGTTITVDPPPSRESSIAYALSTLYESSPSVKYADGSVLYEGKDSINNAVLEIAGQPCIYEISATNETLDELVQSIRPLHGSQLP